MPPARGKQEPSYRRLRRFLVALAAAAVFPLPAAVAATTAERLEAPAASDVADAGPIADSVLPAGAARSLRAASAWWGGRYTAGDEAVTLQISDQYPQDQGVAEHWAAFIGSLVHGSELSSLTAHIAPIDEVQSICGPEALACYSPRESTLVAPGEDVVAGASAEAIVAHEYGHHVAANRSNPPWDAVDYGTKRWASYEQICRDARAGRVYPGAESDPLRYTLNPGEGFAESYRLLNERKLALVESVWEVVSNVFYPDTGALALVERDVLQPWNANSASALNGSFTRRGTSRAHAVATPLDGLLEVTVRAPASARLRVELLTTTGSRVARTTVRGGSRTLRATVCGTRSYRVRVTRLDGRGTYRLAVSKP